MGLTFKYCRDFPRYPDVNLPRDKFGNLIFPLNLERKNMLKFKNDKKRVHVSIVLDQSGSMHSVQKDTLKCLNNQLQLYRNESKSNNIDTTVSIYPFSDVTTTLIESKDIKDVSDIDENSPCMGGNTALWDAIKHGLNHLPHNEETANILLVITDGEENRSVYNSVVGVKSAIESKTATGKFTLVICCPPFKKANIVRQLGVPDGNVTEWEANTVGVQNLDNSLQFSTQAFYSARTRGITSSANYFSPKLDNLTKTVVRNTLDDVTNQYKKLQFTGADRQEISYFISNAGLKFSIGCCYYEQTKVEEVQDFKTLILLEKSSGKLFTGDGVRDLIQIPSGGTIKLSPTFDPKYTVFIRSTSWNRKLIPNTTVLYKV